MSKAVAVIPTLNETYIDEIFNRLKFHGIILSGGNSLSNYSENEDYISKDRDKFEFNLIKKSLQRKIKIFGICRGMQIINVYFKGGLKKVNGHVNVNHKIISLNKKYSFSKVVNSYHNWSIDHKNVATHIEPLAEDLNHNIEAIKYKKQILAVMWHPEREISFKKNDIKLFSCFFNG